MLTVLGGGPAGLAVGWYARQAGLPCTVLEARPVVGGNCITYEEQGFRFDSGAHRFHDKDAEVTADVARLLGDELRSIEVPSYIHDDGALVPFPLAPFHLLGHLGPRAFAKAGLEVLKARSSVREAPANFEEFAIATYGRTVASRFLLNYSEKLWGLPCSRLSPDVAGKRLAGLGLKTFLAEAVGGVRAKDRHVDGRFWYPRAGYGRIVEAMAVACEPGSIRTGTRVARIRHDGRRIRSVETTGGDSFAVDQVVSTLPLDLFLGMLDPAPPAELRTLASAMTYRSVVLAAFFLDRPSINDAGTVYFPAQCYPFTRVYEPRNRSDAMAPPGCTSLVAEVPCATGDATWRMDDEALLGAVRAPLEGIGWIRKGEVLGSAVRRMPHAYPVLEAGYTGLRDRVHAELGCFTNLRFSGRSGRFVYSWLHEMLRFGKDIVADVLAEAGGAQAG